MLNILKLSEFDYRLTRLSHDACKSIVSFGRKQKELQYWLPFRNDFGHNFSLGQQWRWCRQVLATIGNREPYRHPLTITELILTLNSIKKSCLRIDDIDLIVLSYVLIFQSPTTYRIPHSISYPLTFSFLFTHSQYNKYESILFKGYYSFYDPLFYLFNANPLSLF